MRRRSRHFNHRGKPHRRPVQKNGINMDICQIRISEIQSNLDNCKLIVTTSKVRRDYGVPLITGMPFISGIGVDKTEKAILDVLKD